MPLPRSGGLPVTPAWRRDGRRHRVIRLAGRQCAVVAVVPSGRYEGVEEFGKLLVEEYLGKQQPRAVNV